MYKVDLHTHSSASPDGGLSLDNYKRALETGRLDTIAITDHNQIDFAKAAQAKLGQAAIIVGEEISTKQGDLIGLYLTEAVPPGLEIEEAAAAIRRQKGLVYVPHPFETTRHSLSALALERIENAVDIIEIFNGRAVLRNRGRGALTWAANHQKSGAASSDAHGRIGWPGSYSLLQNQPSRETIVSLLAAAEYHRQPAGAGRLYPKLNRLKRKISHA